ncbi:hypothetical protein CA13_37550 [Planctomycetes bacterium CA13]|uniref:Uncharacterized protein n=1 Tax=Novipirellula herctigrandis TaxID=2527986 RepID=A0A5C5Z6Y1_9BACT|nr:hypothetical protein CA13_37550 [Planctomycetes bacterium CA13]
MRSFSIFLTPVVKTGNWPVRKQVQKAVQASASRLRSPADAMHQVVWITDPVGHLLYRHKQGLELLESLSFDHPEKIRPPR